MTDTERGSVLAVGAVVIAPSARVLVVRRGHPPLYGQWTLPGGRVQPGESIVQAVAREVEEETGIAVTVGPLVEVVHLAREGYDYLIHDHLCIPVDEHAQPRAGDDASEARYATTGELAQLGVESVALDVVNKAFAMQQATAVAG